MYFVVTVSSVHSGHGLNTLILSVLISCYPSLFPFSLTSKYSVRDKRLCKRCDILLVSEKNEDKTLEMINLGEFELM